MKLASEKDLESLAAWVKSQGPMGPMTMNPDILYDLIAIAKFANKAHAMLSLISGAEYGLEGKINEVLAEVEKNSIGEGHVKE